MLIASHSLVTLNANAVLKDILGNMAQATQSSPSLLTLPLEIRLQICTFAFSPSCQRCPHPRLIIGRNLHGPNDAQLIPPLCLVNHQLYGEALSVWLQSAEFTPVQESLLPELSRRLTSLTSQGLQNIRILNIGHCGGLDSSEAQVTSQFLSQLPKLQYLRLKLDCRSLTYPFSTSSIIQTFRLTHILDLISLETLSITIETAPPPPPSGELRGLLGLVQMQRMRKERGMRDADKATIGNRRLYTFTEGNKKITREIREWFRSGWKVRGREVRVLDDREEWVACEECEEELW